MNKKFENNHPRWERSSSPNAASAFRTTETKLFLLNKKVAVAVALLAHERNVYDFKHKRIISFDEAELL